MGSVMKRANATVILAGLAHGLAWAAFLWLVLWPYSYRGEVAVAVAPGEPRGEVTRVHASFIEVNGLQVLPVLLAPVGLSAVGLLAIIRWGARRGGRALVWLSAALMLAFCALGVFSIGLLYAPGALGLLAAAVVWKPPRSAGSTVY